MRGTRLEGLVGIWRLRRASFLAGSDLRVDYIGNREFIRRGIDEGEDNLALSLAPFRSSMCAPMRGRHAKFPVFGSRSQR
jgi:hypothetical protein